MNAQHENKEFIQNTSFPRNDSLQTKETKATTLIANVLETGSNDSMILQNDCRSMNKEKDMQIPNDDSDDDTKSYCVICLNTCEDRTVLETCHHEFCFHCILQWSMISHSCPLCIQVFESCIHNILDDLNYTVHRFEKPTSSSKGPSTGSPSSSTSSATSRRQQQIAVPYGIIRQLYGPAQRRRRFRNPPNVDLAEQTVTEHQQSALEKRRHVYRHRLFVKHIGANRITGFQQITPETFRIFPHKLDRLIPWVRRELQAILSLASPPTSDSSTSASGPSETTYDLPQGADRGVELIREYIIAVMKRYDLQTDQGQDLLRDFLYEHTEQFVHELMGFARSNIAEGEDRKEGTKALINAVGVGIDEGAGVAVLKSNASERNKDNKADAVLIEGMEGIKPGDSPLKNRDVVMATLQAKLKRERDLYAANNHNKPATK
ncbi:hypothetical protein BGX27_009421 [Mortierella sp. AM989]|nr:hypothetical protein BGX27_009421 [Mortierella sp. AM989]